MDTLFRYIIFLGVFVAYVCLSIFLLTLLIKPWNKAKLDRLPNMVQFYIVALGWIGVAYIVAYSTYYTATWIESLIR